MEIDHQLAEWSLYISVEMQVLNSVHISLKES